MKHLTKLFLTLSLIVTLVLGVLVDATSKRTAPRGTPQRSLIRKQKHLASTQPAPIQPTSGHRPLPATPGVVAVDTTSPIHLLDDLSWLFIEVHYAAHLVGIPLVLKASYDVSYDVSYGRISWQEPTLEYIERVVTNVVKSLGKPKVHSLGFISLLVNRYVPWNFTVESFFGLDKYIDPATFKFTRLVAVFYFASYIYRAPSYVTGLELMMSYILLSCLSCFFPVFAVVFAALGEVILFVFSMVRERRVRRVVGEGEE